MMVQCLNFRYLPVSCSDPEVSAGTMESPPMLLELFIG